MTQETITQVIRLIPDEGAVQQSAAAVQKVADQVVNLNADFSKLGPVARAGALDIEQRFGDLDSGIAEHRANVKALADEYDNLGSSATSAAQSASAAQSSGGGLSLRQGVREAGGLLATVGAGQAGSAVSSVLALTESLGPVGVAAGVAAIALKSAADEEQKRAEAAKAYITAIGSVADKTSSQIQQSIDDQQQQLNAYQSSQAALQKLADQADDLSRRSTLFPGQDGALSQDAYLAALDELDAKVKASTGGIIENTAGLTDALSEGQTQINKTQGSVNFLGLALENVNTAANDAAAAAVKLAKTQEDAATLAIQIDGLTKAQRDTRAAQDQREIELINERIQSGELGNQATYDLSVKQQQLYEDYQAVTSVSDTYADVLEREKAAKKTLTDANQSYLDVLTTEGKTRDAITVQQAKIDQLNSDAATKETDLLTQKNDKITDIEAQAGEGRAKIAQDSADAIAKIERDAGREQFADIANRDAAAFTQSQLKKKDAEDDQKKADAKALTTLNSNLDKQEKTVDVSYKQQVQQVESSLRTQVATQRQGLLQLQTDLLNEKNSELALSKQFGIGIVSQHEYMLQGIESAVLSYGVRIVSGLNSILSGFQPLPPPSNGGSQGAMTVDKVNAIVRSNMANYIGLRQGG